MSGGRSAINCGLLVSPGKAASSPGVVARVGRTVFTPRDVGSEEPLFWLKWGWVPALLVAFPSRKSLTLAVTETEGSEVDGDEKGFILPQPDSKIPHTAHLMKSAFLLT